jgi:hypothetical protein
MCIKKKIVFYFNTIKETITIPLKYLLEQKDSLKKIIKDECNKLNITLFEENIILYDEKNDILIHIVQDLIENKTLKCKIIIKPINY